MYSGGGEQVVINPHSMDPAMLLSMARSMGEVRSELYIVGCEPADFGDELTGRMGLSEAVANAVPVAAQAVLDLIARIDKQREAYGTTNDPIQLEESKP